MLKSLHFASDCLILLFYRLDCQGDQCSHLHPAVDATMNYWGGGTTAFVGGRVWDGADDGFLIEVTFWPAHENNRTIMEGQ